LTTTTRVSSEVSAMLVERVGAASAVFGAVVVGRTAAAVINIAARPQDAIVREQSLEDCEFFMKVASGLYGSASNTLVPSVRSTAVEHRQ
jgi:hypothetical protein